MSEASGRALADEDRRPGIDARDQSLPCDGRDPPVRADLAGRDLAIDRTEPDDRFGDHRGAARRPSDHPAADRRRARRGPRPAARHARAQSGRRACRRREARARPDHGRRHQFLRRHPALACRCRSASTARRPRSSPIWSRTACAAASATPVSRLADISGVCVGLPGVVERAAGRLPAEPDLPRARRAARRRSRAATRRAGVDRQRRQSRRRSPSTGSARRATSTTFSSSTSSAASASASCTMASCSAARTASAPISAISWCARRRRRRPARRRRLGDLGSGRRRGAAARRRRDAAFAAGAGDGRCSCNARPTATPLRSTSLAAAGEALGFAIANLITLFAPPKVIISGRAMATSEHFIGPLRATVAALAAGEPRRRVGYRRARVERRDLGARRGGDDAARSLRRAVEHDRSGAASATLGVA